MKIKIFSLTLLILLMFSYLTAEIDIQTYVDKTKIGTQDILKLTIEISGKKAGSVPQPELPEIKNFVNRGVSTSSSSSYSIINGKMESQVTKSYIFRLQPQKAGNFIIPPISLRYKGKNHTTQPIKINVVQGSTEPAPPTSSRHQRREKPSASSSQKLSDNLFLKTIVNKRSVYKNEPLIVKYKLYSRYNISNLSFGEEPDFQGFWKDDIFIPKQVNFDRENYQGQLFSTMLMRSTALIPNEAGELEIPSQEMVVDIRTEPRSFFDFGSSKRYTIRSKPVKIKVKELPLQNRPINFSNAVGQFQLESNINSNVLKVGDSFTYTIRISGTGNINQIEVPKLPDINNLRFLDPEISTSVNNNKISGTKTIKYLVIAQEKGQFQLPAIKFTFFDTKSKSYRTLQTEIYDLSVSEGESNFIQSSAAQSIVQQEGTDISFIITKSELKNKTILVEKFLFWFIWFLLIFTIPIVKIYAKERNKLAGNADYLRQKKAKRILKKYLKQASRKAAATDPEFYTAVQNGLSNYLADKLTIARGSSTEELFQKLKENLSDENTYTELQKIFAKCDQARFMPGGFSKKDITEDFEKVKNLLSKLSRIKGGKK